MDYRSRLCFNCRQPHLGNGVPDSRQGPDQERRVGTYGSHNAVDCALCLYLVRPLHGLDPIDRHPNVGALASGLDN